MRFVENFDHLLEAGHSAINYVIGQQHREWLLPHEFARHQHSMAQSHCLFLTDVGDMNHVADLPDHAKQVGFLSLLEHFFQLVADIEVIFDRSLAAARDDDDLVATGSQRLFYAILNDWFINDRQHFFWLGFGRRQEARAQTCCRKHRLADFHRHLELPRINEDQYFSQLVFQFVSASVLTGRSRLTN